jgi:FkbM family methyltransferase
MNKPESPATKISTTESTEGLPHEDSRAAGAPPAGAGERQRVSPTALALAVACSVLIVGIAHYWKQAATSAAAAVELQQRLQQTQRAMGRLQMQARLGDPEALPKLRDVQYDFVVNNYGFEYEGRTGDLIDEQILAYGLWEKGPAFFMRDYLQKCENKDAVFLDVGCNAGHHSLFLAPYAAHVHGFDPYLPAVERFQKMIDRNHKTNVTVHPVGLGQEDAELPFFAPYEGNFGSGTFNQKMEHEARRELKLRIVRGDDWLAEKNITGIELIKIDIEGYEEAALIGLRSTLETQRPVVFVEVTSGPEGTITSLDQLKTLFPENYEFLAVVEYLWTTPVNGKYITAPFGPQEAKSFFASTTQGMIAAYPMEKKAWVPDQPREDPKTAAGEDQKSADGEDQKSADGEVPKVDALSDKQQADAAEPTSQAEPPATVEPPATAEPPAAAEPPVTESDAAIPASDKPASDKAAGATP